MFKLPTLPFSKELLTPLMTKETFDYHYDKHHAAYVNKLNSLLEAQNELKNLTLEEIVKKAQPGPLFNNAAQAWNHTFFWNSLCPENKSKPSTKVQDLIKTSFGSMDQFKKQFVDTGIATFGSGWVWLIREPNGSMKLEGSSNAATPISQGRVPLLVCDVWEHAYYIDYRNARDKYLDSYFRIINWNYLEENYGKNQIPQLTQQMQ